MRCALVRYRDLLVGVGVAQEKGSGVIQQIAKRIRGTVVSQPRPITVGQPE
jgi:hypothetical protein